MREIQIDPEVVDPEIDMLQDLVVAAVMMLCKAQEESGGWANHRGKKARLVLGRRS